MVSNHPSWLQNIEHHVYRQIDINKYLCFIGVKKLHKKPSTRKAKGQKNTITWTKRVFLMVNIKRNSLTEFPLNTGYFFFSRHPEID